MIIECHLIECSDPKKYARNMCILSRPRGLNTLDAALNDARIWKILYVWNKVKK